MVRLDCVVRASFYETLTPEAAAALDDLREKREKGARAAA